MHRTKSASVGVAVIRAVVEPGPRPLIRIIKVTDLARDDHAIAVTVSPEEATRIVAEWLHAVILESGRRAALSRASEDPTTLR